MKVYRVNKYTDEGTLVSWHSSKRQAEAALRKFAREYGKDSWDPTDVHAVEIPTNRAGLISWLNRNLNTDNG